MSYHLVLGEGVEADIQKAAVWYNRQLDGLGRDFAREVRQAINSLEVRPLRFQIRHQIAEIRWVFTRRFPDRVAFVVEGSAVVVLAVSHAKRRVSHDVKRLKKQ